MLNYHTTKGDSGRVDEVRFVIGLTKTSDMDIFTLPSTFLTFLLRVCKFTLYFWQYFLKTLKDTWLPKAGNSHIKVSIPCRKIVLGNFFLSQHQALTKFWSAFHLFSKLNFKSWLDLAMDLGIYFNVVGTFYFKPFYDP